jgi:hypothetical protein
MSGACQIKGNCTLLDNAASQKVSGYDLDATIHVYQNWTSK